MKHIVLTGGGTAGHVTPNIALIPTLKAAGYQISYIGSYEGIERKLIEEMGIPYSKYQKLHHLLNILMDIICQFQVLQLLLKTPKTSG